MSHIHIPDGVLPAWLWVSGWALAAALLLLSSAAASDTEARRRVPLLGVVSALVLVAMSSEIVPLAYHVNLTVVAGVLLGPALSVMAAFIAVTVLALLGHGGVTVIGLNTVVIAAEMVLGWALFRAFVRLLGRRRTRPSALLATVLTLAVTTSMLVGIVALAGGGLATRRETGALDPRRLRFENPFGEGVFQIGLLRGEEPEGGTAEAPLSVGRFAAVVYTLGPPGWMLEALVTAAVLGYVARMRPGLVFRGAPRESLHRHAGDEGSVR